MIVLRVEHKRTKGGPYFNIGEHCSKVNHIMQDKHSGNDNKRPGYRADFDWFYSPEWRFGFDSTLDCINWFSDSWDLLQEDFMVSLYDVDDIIFGHSGLQVQFKVERAKYIGSYEIPEFLEKAA